MRSNRATIIEDVFARNARVQDGITEFQCGATAGLSVVDTATITSGRVAADSAVAYGHRGRRRRLSHWFEPSQAHFLFSVDQN